MASLLPIRDFRKRIFQRQRDVGYIFGIASEVLPYRAKMSSIVDERAAATRTAGAGFPIPARLDRDAAFQAVREAAVRRGLSVELHTELARITERGTLIVPASLKDTGKSAYEEAVLTGELEDAWNEQDPLPPFRVFVVPPAALIEMGGSRPLSED